MVPWKWVQTCALIGQSKTIHGSDWLIEKMSGVYYYLRTITSYWLPLLLFIFLLMSSVCSHSPGKTKNFSTKTFIRYFFIFNFSILEYFAMSQVQVVYSFLSTRRNWCAESTNYWGSELGLPTSLGTPRIFAINEVYQPF